MSNELITEHDERIRSYFQALERLSKALETLFSKRKSSLDGESFYTCLLYTSDAAAILLV